MSPDLTFGLELEMVLGFHHDLLRRQLDKSPDKSSWKVVTQPGYLKRQSTQGTMYHTRQYQAWALHNPSATNIADTVALVDGKDPTVRSAHQAYLEEPLEIARDILQPALPNVAVHSDLQNKQSDFSTWTLVRDPSIDSLTRQQLSDTFDRDELLPSRTQDWDSYGIELVSPVMSSTAQATVDLAAALSTLHSGGTNPHHDVMTTTQCGLHVHIGTRTGCALPLPVLQHLAFLHLVYEHELDRLLPLHRRSTSGNAELWTNRAHFFAEGADPVVRQVIDPTGITAIVSSYPVFVPLSEVRASIYSTASIEELVQLMGKDKQHLVNFSYAARQEGQGPATVELRAYDASTDVREIEAWVKFCLGLVRLAYRMAGGEVGLELGEWGEEGGLEGLWELMGLVDAEKAYWRGKVEEKALLWPDWRPVEFWEDDTLGELD
ncbi:hypothetical protein MBLNU457_g0881t1 [Dothideomycetes sp. NU457]